MTAADGAVAAGASVPAGVHVVAGVHGVAAGIHVAGGVHVDDGVHGAAGIRAAAAAARSSRRPPWWRRPTAVSAGLSRPFSSTDRAIAVIPRPPQCGSCGTRRSAVRPLFGIWHAPTAVAGRTANNNTTAMPPDRPSALLRPLVGIAVGHRTIIS